jgi:hypothetical protein
MIVFGHPTAGPVTMLDTPTARTTLLRDLRRKPLAKPATLPAIFQTGDRILAATTAPAAIPGDLASQRVAILGSVTIDYLSRAVACGILAEGTAPVVYQAPFGASPAEVDAAPPAQPTAVRPGHPDLGARLVPATA